MSVRIAIIQFPGSNCERETILAVKRAGMIPEEFLWNAPLDTLETYEGYIIVGGFSYEDRSRAGIIAALDPLLQHLKKASQTGKPILGICNGAQILVESGLVPGLENDQVGMVLTDNKRVKNGNVLGTGYYNAWVHMRLSDNYQLNAFTQCVTPDTVLPVPIAHGEGRFIIPPALLMEMQNNGQTVFQYCDATGVIKDEFPINPNGSVLNIAAVSNKAGNVMAMMPHPERTPLCDGIFQSIRAYIEEAYTSKVSPLHYMVRPYDVLSYIPSKEVFTFCVALHITDNQALSVNQALKHLGIVQQVKRYVYWEIECQSADVFSTIKHSGILFNPRKETLVTKPQGINLLIKPKEDLIGLERLQLLKNHSNIAGIQKISFGILWHLGEKSHITEQDISHIIHSHLLFNRYAHDCYYY